MGEELAVEAGSKHREEDIYTVGKSRAGWK